MTQKIQFTAIFICLLLAATGFSQSTIYSESFTGQNGKGATGSSGSISVDVSGVDWSVDTTGVTMTATSDYMKVVSEVFEFLDIDGFGKWSSPSIDISSYSSLKLSIDLSEDGTLDPEDSISVYYNIDAGGDVLLYTAEDDFTAKTLTDTSISGTGNSMVITIQAYNNVGTEYLRFDNLSLTGTFSNDIDSEIDEPTTQVSDDTISSLLDSQAEAKDIFKFKIIDAGTADGKASKVTNLRLKPGANNTADWTDNIAGFTVNDGASVTIGTPTITDTTIDIPITSGNMDASDNSTANITLGVYLNSSGLIDNDTIQFLIDADDHGFTVDSSGSVFKTTINSGTNISSAKMAIYVASTKLEFGVNASEATINVFKRLSPTVRATDANGNVDKDMTNDISITSSGTLSGTTVTEAAVLGVATFDSLKHTVSGTGIQLTASSTGLTSVVSSTFNVVSQQGLPISAVNTIHLIDFDNTVDGINEGAFNGSGFVNSQSTGKINSNGISISGASQGDVAFGGIDTTGDYARGTSTGGVSTGGVYAFETSSGNYSLGLQAISSDFTPGSVTLRLQNHTEQDLTSFMLSFVGISYNDQDRSTKIETSYSSDNATYSSLSDVTIVTIDTAESSPIWKKHLYIVDINSILVETGAYYYFKFDVDDSAGSGSRDEIAMDDIRIVGYGLSKTNGQVGGLEGDYNTLNINGSGVTVVASGDVNVFKQLKLKSGYVDLNSNRMTIGSSEGDCEVSDYSTASFIFDGPVRQHMNNDTNTYIFPMGTAASTAHYSRTEIKLNTVTLASGSYIETTVDQGKHPNYDISVTNYINRYYQKEASGISNINYDVKLYYQDGDIVGSESSIVPVKYSSGWTAPTGVGGGKVPTDGTGSIVEADNYLSWKGLTGFSIFSGAGDGTPLPVELLSFDAKIQLDQVLLLWSTASEINTSRFEIEYAEHGKDYETIGEVQAIGYSNVKNEYSYTVEKRSSANHYFRLKMIDRNGSFEYSSVIHVSDAHKKTNTVSVSQTISSLEIINTSEEKLNWKIIDISGSHLESGEINGEITRISTEEMNAGIYLLILESESGIYRRERFSLY